MKHIILLLLLGVYSLAFAQNKIEGLWYLFDLFGEKPSMEMFRLERQTQERSGYRIEIDIQGRLLPVVGFSYTDPKALYLHWSICCPLWIESYYLI